MQICCRYFAVEFSGGDITIVNIINVEIRNSMENILLYVLVHTIIISLLPQVLLQLCIILWFAFQVLLCEHLNNQPILAILFISITLNKMESKINLSNSEEGE